MSTFSNHHLDQAVDHYAFLIDPTAKEYEAYLEGEYKHNMKERWASWKDHYLRMREAFRDCLMTVIEERNLYRRDMNIAIIGPGFSPIGHDFGEDDVGPILRRLNSIVLCDISQRVCTSARDEFIAAAVPPPMIHAMQYDITNGLSTVCKQVIGAKLAGIGTEEKLSAFTDHLEGLEVGELENQILDETAKIPHIRRPSLLEGGENVERTWKLTVEGKPLPLDVVSYQMVLAGTLAHVMQNFRDRFEEITSVEDQNPGKATEQARLAMFERMHNFLAKCNTQIAIRSIRKVLEDNPSATVLGITDVSTVYQRPRFGRLPQIDEIRLKHELAHPEDDPQAQGVPPIVTRALNAWSWFDEPEHHHEVNHMEFEVMKEPPKNGHA